MIVRSAVVLVALGACQPQDNLPTDDGGMTPGPFSTPPDTNEPPDTTPPTPPETTPPPSTTMPTLLEAICTQEINPLMFSCDVTVEPAQPVQITFVRTDGIGVTRTHTSELESTTHTIPLYFMGPKRDYTIELRATAWLGETDPLFTATLTTGDPPNTVESHLEMTGTSTMGLIGTENPCEGNAVAVIYDTVTGDLVWFRNVDPSPGATLGILDMVRFTDERTIIGETGESIVEVDLFGTELARISTEDLGGCCGAHHDVFKWNDQFYAMHQDFALGATLDEVVIYDSLGNELRRWHAADYLDIPGFASGDFLHTNSIYVDANGDLYLDWLNQSSFGKMNGDINDPAFGEVQWILSGDPSDNDIGHHVEVDWSNVGDNDFGFQHNMHVRNDGRLMVLDNTNGRGLVFTLDDTTDPITAVVDAEYETRENSCGAQGTAMDTKAGNAVVGCNTTWVREYDVASSDMIWEAQVDCQNGGDFFGATRWYPLDSW
jgi:hypothetical protein